MDAARKPDDAVPQIGILPHIYTSDPNRERQNATVRRGRNLQSSDYKRTKLPALETETPTNVNESLVISLLESRVKSVEDANQSLREEVVQLQHELKQIGTKATNFQDQHSPWLAIMDTIKASNDMITQLVSRLKETENMLYFEKESIESLLSHMRQLDDDITDQQEERKRHEIDLEHRIVELQTAVHDIEGQENQTKTMIMTLLNDIGEEKKKIEWMFSQTKLMKSEMEQVSRRMADDINVALSGIQKQNEVQRQAERSVMQIQGTFEKRLIQIEDEFTYLRSKQTDLESEGKVLDRKINARLHELTAAIAQQDHKMEDNLQKEIDRSHSPENLYPQGKIHQLMEELSTRLFQKEMELREEIQKRFFDLEKKLRKFETLRNENENVLKAENEKNWFSLQKLHMEEIKALEDKQSRFRLPEHYMKLDDNIKKLAATFTDDMNWIEKVLKSEIMERMKQGTQLGNKMDDLHERLSLALAALQEALGTLQEDLKSEMKKTQEMQAKFAESKTEQDTKLKEDFQHRDIESVCRTMGTLFADIYRIKEETPGEIAKIKENLMVCIGAIKSLRSDLIKLKSRANLEQGDDAHPRNRLFVKNPDVTEDKTINRWGIYQAIRWMQWKTHLRNKIQKLRLKDQSNSSLLV